MTKGTIYIMLVAKLKTMKLCKLSIRIKILYIIATNSLDLLSYIVEKQRKCSETKINKNVTILVPQKLGAVGI